MSDATARATEVIGEVSGLSAEECEEIAAALERADLLAEPLDGFETTSEAQDWVMIPADQVHDEWAVERPDPVDQQPRYDRFPTLDAALAERWGNDRAVHRVATGWEPVDPDEGALDGEAA
ncbi:MAG: hypothetical protein ACK4UY_03935 [Dietzia sp.]